MSGPKIDSAELERQRKAELERLRQERLRRIRAETEKLNNEITKAKAQLNFINNHLSSYTSRLGNADDMSFTFAQLNSIKDTYKKMISKAVDVDVPTEPEAISARTLELARTVLEIERAYKRETNMFTDRFIAYEKDLSHVKSLEVLSNSFSGVFEKREKIEDFDFNGMADKVSASDIEAGIKERAARIMAEISDLVNSEAIQESDMQTLLAIANNVYDTAYKTKSYFEAAAIEYGVARGSVVRNISIFDELYQEYYAEYVVYLEAINKNRVAPLQITPKEKYQFYSIEDLENETKILSRTSKAVIEANEIREQINEVMEQFNYNMTEEIVLFENQKGNHYICENKSRRAAIHVYMSDKSVTGKQQIMMEVVGTGGATGSDSIIGTNNTSDLNTGDNTAVTSVLVPSKDLESHERDELVREQGRFCDLHPKIVEELARRGVLLNEHSRKPVGPENSKMIHAKSYERTVSGAVVSAASAASTATGASTASGAATSAASASAAFSGANMALINERATRRPQQLKSGSKERYHAMKIR